MRPTRVVQHLQGAVLIEALQIGARGSRGVCSMRAGDIQGKGQAPQHFADGAGNGVFRVIGIEDGLAGFVPQEQAQSRFLRQHGHFHGREVVLEVSAAGGEEQAAGQGGGSEVGGEGLAQVHGILHVVQHDQAVGVSRR